MSNRWVEFVRKWAKRHNKSYMCAATTKRCQAKYHKTYPELGKREKSTIRRTRRNKQKAQRELLEKYKPYAENKGMRGEDRDA
jgi:hypothetical protein